MEEGLEHFFLLQLEYGVAQQCYVLGIEEAVVDELT
jgi:hypothetical protein